MSIRGLRKRRRSGEGGIERFEAVKGARRMTAGDRILVGGRVIMWGA